MYWTIGEESQKVSEFIANLQGDLKEHLLINYPKNLEEAFQKARIKSAAQQHNNKKTEARIAILLELQKEQTKATSQIKKMADELKSEISVDMMQDSLNHSTDTNQAKHCYRCHKMGHLVRNCRQPKPPSRLRRNNAHSEYQAANWRETNQDNL